MTSLFDALPTDNRTSEGEARRDAALGLLRVRHESLIRKLTASALRIALTAGEVCSDDLREAVPIPIGISPKCVGPVFADLATTGILQHVEYRKSRRPAAHARPISVWRISNLDTALARLAELETLIAATDAAGSSTAD